MKQDTTKQDCSLNSTRGEEKNNNRSGTGWGHARPNSLVSLLVMNRARYRSPLLSRATVVGTMFTSIGREEGRFTIKFLSVFFARSIGSLKGSRSASKTAHCNERVPSCSLLTGIRELDYWIFELNYSTITLVSAS